MIKGVHAMFYTPQADELRAFFRDKLEMKYIDAGGGWLIFNPPAAEIGCHPGDTIKHDISLYCDDIQTTVADLRAKGVEFTNEIEDHGYGFSTNILAPGGLEIQLFQAKY
jgi:catechol 2,3-dioxygenase-like lactoylglutathione lyase family enzyme